MAGIEMMPAAWRVVEGMVSVCSNVTDFVIPGCCLPGLMPFGALANPPIGSGWHVSDRTDYAVHGTKWGYHGMRFTRASSGRRLAGGFSLLELMITVAVLAIVLAAGVPSFQSMVQRNRVVAAANELVAAMQIARAEAVRRNRRVALCPSTNDNGCSGGDWSRVMVFVDADSGNDFDAGEEIVRVVRLQSSGLDLRGSASIVGGSNMIAFGSDGLARIGAGRVGSLGICSTKLPQEGDNTRVLTVNVSRISVGSRSGSLCSVAPANEGVTTQ